MENTVGFWSILPPLLAIVLSLLTREIVLSLSVAIFSGTLIYTLNGLGNFDGALPSCRSRCSSSRAASVS